MHEKMQMQQQIEVQSVKGKQLSPRHRYRQIPVFQIMAINDYQKWKPNQSNVAYKMNKFH
jgi:hypothetical protein